MKLRQLFFSKTLFASVAIFMVAVFYAHSTTAAPSIVQGFQLAGSGGLHGFTGLPLTNDGWTDLQALVQSDSRIVYVSTSGDDSTGLYYSPNDSVIGDNPFNPTGAIAPYATFIKAYSKLRDGYPDIVLFKRGDTWSASSFMKLDKSGRSQTERMIVGAYGATGNRPKFNNTYVAFTVRSSYIILTDLELEHVDRNPLESDYNGIEWEGSSSHTLIEGIYIHYFKSNFVCQSNDSLGNPVITDVALRRNVIADGWGGPTHGQGIYTHQISDLLIEENVFDHNGWEATHKKQTVFDRSMYLSRTSGTIVRGNIDARGASGGVQMRRGGVYDYNLSLQNPVAVAVGHSQSIIDSTSSIRYNVILDSRDIETSPRGNAIAVGNRQVNTVVHDNIIAHQISGTDNIYPISLTGETGMTYQDPAECPPPCYSYTVNTQITNNIVYKWDKNGIPMDTVLRIGQATIGVTAQNNIFQQPSGGELVMYIEGTQHSGPDASWVFSGNTYSAGSNTMPFEADGVLMNYATWIADVSETGSSTSAVSFTAPERTIESYAQAMGLSPTGYEDGLDKFLQETRKQSRVNWNEKYTAVAVINYIREGFNRAPVSLSYSAY
ncbi:hypothetical protein KAR91_05015 [Candidatus Pacearchaeota archaeon]|nr:hypothetical protein [Candidatus Pacearchaeota archaeon]